MIFRSFEAHGGDDATKRIEKSGHSKAFVAELFFTRQLLGLAASVHWYQQGRISQEWAAKIAGMDRTDFLLTPARMGRDSFVVDFDDLDDELARG